VNRVAPEQRDHLEIGGALLPSRSASGTVLRKPGKGEFMGLSALVVKIRMKAEYREQFLEQMRADALGSEKNEPGCLMFNIVQDNADPDVLHLFEVYEDAEAVEAHKKAPHFLKWLETTKDWLAAPLEIARGATVYPPAGAWKKRSAP
jgi:autoinducer 2-degrading protein